MDSMMYNLLQFVTNGAYSDIDKVLCIVLFFIIFEQIFKIIAELIKIGRSI